MGRVACMRAEKYMQSLR